jgi:hypothetical protein
MTRDGFERSVPLEGVGLERRRSIFGTRLKPVPGAIGSSTPEPVLGRAVGGDYRIWAARSVRYLAVDENCQLEREATR